MLIIAICISFLRQNRVILKSKPPSFFIEGGFDFWKVLIFQGG